MPERTEQQHATVTTMIDIAEGMAAQTQRIARHEGARLAEALRHIETAASDLQRLRGIERS